MGKAAKFDGRVKGGYEFSWNFIKLTCVTRIAVPVSITFKIYDLIKPDFFANTILLVAIAYPKVCLPPPSFPLSFLSPFFLLLFFLPSPLSFLFYLTLQKAYLHLLTIHCCSCRQRYKDKIVDRKNRAIPIPLTRND